MEKISGILPASPRTRSADVTQSPTLRPGTPSFGNPTGASTAEDKISFSPSALDRLNSETWKDKDSRMANIAQSVNDNFSVRTPNKEELVRSSGTVEQTLKNAQAQANKDLYRPIAEAKVAEFFAAADDLTNDPEQFVRTGPVLVATPVQAQESYGAARAPDMLGMTLSVQA